MSLKKTILLVDDDPSVLKMLALALEASYDVLIAANGLEAAYLYERNLKKVVALVTDLEMPRLDGQSLTEWVHHIRPTLPVIIMSGSRQNTLPELKQQPMIRFLGKPFQPSQLKIALRNALRVQTEAV